MRKKTVQFFISVAKLLLWIAWFGKAGIKAEEVIKTLETGGKEYEKYGSEEPEFVLEQHFGADAQKIISSEQLARDNERGKIIGTINEMIDIGTAGTTYTEEQKEALMVAIDMIQKPISREVEV